MVVIKPKDDDNFDDEWQGSINQLSKIVQRNVNSLEKKLNKRMDHQSLAL